MHASKWMSLNHTQDIEDAALHFIKINIKKKSSSFPTMTWRYSFIHRLTAGISYNIKDYKLPCIAQDLSAGHAKSVKCTRMSTITPIYITTKFTLQLTEKTT